MIELVREVLKGGDVSVDECRSKTFAAITRRNGLKILPIFCMITRLNQSSLWQP